MAIEGVDYAGSRPDPVKLYAAGKRFAVRYGGPGGSWKHLTAAEARALTAAGLALVANAEGTADGLLGGWSVGADWARSADQHFRGLGMPASRPIYLSVDFNVTSSQWPAVREALRGAASVIGPARVGVYGGRLAIEWARRDGVARWFWQTYAWSAGIWVPGNHIEQYNNAEQVAGGVVDLCRARVADYGQWTLGAQPQPQEDDMPLTNDDGKTVWSTDIIPSGDPTNPTWGAAWALGELLRRAARAEAYAKAAAGIDLDEDAIVQGVLAGLGAKDPATIAAALRAVMTPDQILAVGQLLVQG